MSHQNVPTWKRATPKGVAYHRDLYTRSTEQTVDVLETWFDTHFENPAEKPIQKAIHDCKLNPEDWRKLIRFFALQDVRTPARLMEHLNRTRQMLPDVMDEVLHDAKIALESGELTAKEPRPTQHKAPFPFPVKLVQQPDSNPDKVKIGVVSTPGRATWQHAINHVLNNTATILHQHKWTLLKPASGYDWPTSDNPVVKLNYYKRGKYDFGGGYARNGTELLLPLGPQHLMYTKVGSKPPRRGTRFNPAITKEIQRFIVESSHRMVFSSQPDKSISQLKQRIVDASAVKNEKLQWEQWHQEQSEVEAQYFLTKGDIDC